MKKIFQIVIFYAIGFVCVYTLAWRVDSINSANNNSLANNYKTNNVVLNN